MPPLKHARIPADRLSDVLAKLAEPVTGPLTLADLLGSAGDRSFGALLVLFAVPNLLASVLPGLSILLGLPLMLLSLQLAVAARRPWLPSRVARLTIDRAGFRSVVERVNPYLRRLERALKPRLPLLTTPWAERLIGVACLGLSILVFLPIPLANLPPAVAIALFGLALMERDGLVALAATALAGVCAALFGGVAAAVMLTAARAIG